MKKIFLAILVFQTFELDVVSCRVNEVNSKQMDRKLILLLKSRTFGNLNREMSLYQGQERAWLVCLEQLRGDKVPSACFEWLEFEKSNQTKFEVESEKLDPAWLDEVCARAAGAEIKWSELNSVLKSRHLSAKCKEAVASRIADIDYIDRRDRPANLFVRQFMGAK